MRTVGVAPGTFTLRLGAAGLGACPPDEIGASYGVPAVGWYNAVQPVASSDGGGDALNTYGTQSKLQGLRAAVIPTRLSTAIKTPTVSITTSAPVTSAPTAYAASPLTATCPDGSVVPFGTGCPLMPVDAPWWTSPWVFVLGALVGVGVYRWKKGKANAA